MNQKELCRCVLCGAIAATTLAFAVTSSGCGRKEVVQNNTTTVGQELQDLDDAHNKGLLTDAEYKKKREAIMKRK